MKTPRIRLAEEVLCLLCCYTFQQYRLCGFCNSSPVSWREGQDYYREHHLAKMNRAIAQLERFPVPRPAGFTHLPHPPLRPDLSRFPLLWRRTPFGKICRRVFSFRTHCRIPEPCIGNLLFLFRKVRFFYEEAQSEPDGIQEITDLLGKLLDQLSARTFWREMRALEMPDSLVEAFGHPRFLLCIPVDACMVFWFRKSEALILEEDWLEEETAPRS